VAQEMQVLLVEPVEPEDKVAQEMQVLLVEPGEPEVPEVP
jgi:hypothetical protein